MDAVERFLEIAPAAEKAIVESGVILIKYWLEVSQDEQRRRLEARISDPRKIWKLSPMDLKSFARWYDYSRARDDMFKATDTAWAPWHVVRSDDKRRARRARESHLSLATTELTVQACAITVTYYGDSALIAESDGVGTLPPSSRNYCTVTVMPIAWSCAWSRGRGPCRGRFPAGGLSG